MSTIRLGPEASPQKSHIRFTLIAGFAITLVVNSLLLAYFHNRFWWPPDEGAYAHTAERILKGEVLNADVEEIHPGYLTFINAAAFKLFGLRLVSLRYPLVVAAFIQSCLLFLMFARRDVMLAVIAATSAISLGVIQFLNPTPNWYCLLFATLTTLVLTCFPQRAWRVVVAGFLVGLVLLFRQITGVFLAMAVLTYLLTEKTELTPIKETLLARGLLITMLIGTTAYLKSATDVYGLLLYGIWPIVLLVLAIFFVTTSNRRSLKILLMMGAGFIAACLPIIVYHLVHGSLRAFVDDTVMRALQVSNFSYLKLASYATLQFHGLRNFFSFDSVAITVNGIYWFLLPLTALVCGVATVRAFKNARASEGVGALPIVAIFYGLVALLQQIPIYLSYALPLTLAAVFWLALPARKSIRLATSVLAVFFSVVAIYYHAAQPITRRTVGIIRGERVGFVPASTLERTGLSVDQESLGIYTELVQTIKQASQPDESLFVLPNNPELYFLAERKNPFRFWNSAIGVRDANEASLVLDVLRTNPPRIIVIAPSDRNNTPASMEIVTYVRDHYSLIKKISAFDIYRAP